MSLPDPLIGFVYAVKLWLTDGRVWLLGSSSGTWLTAFPCRQLQGWDNRTAGSAPGWIPHPARNLFYPPYFKLGRGTIWNMKNSKYVLLMLMTWKCLSFIFSMIFFFSCEFKKKRNWRTQSPQYVIRRRLQADNEQKERWLAALSLPSPKSNGWQQAKASKCLCPSMYVYDCLPHQDNSDKKDKPNFCKALLLIWVCSSSTTQLFFTTATQDLLFKICC